MSDPYARFWASGKRRRRGRAVAGAAGLTALACVAGYVVTGGTGGSGGGSAGTSLAADAGRASTPPRTASAAPSHAASPRTAPSHAAAGKERVRSRTEASSTATPSPRPTKPAAPGAGSGSGSAGSGPAAQVLALVNAERARHGCRPVTADARLRRAAQAFSADMAARNFFDHTSPDGSTPGDRITAAGYRWSTYGENIAAGQRTPADVMNAWMNSPGHRANILNCAFTGLGVGLATAGGTPRWTQDFAAPR
ncbi:CAP domain-containing protein [Actinomadura atramentaria]|uniref:CAP domain-containing protein n=1 Tax=Actinomadura atramentaria TaxID=1990 RepID=UPI0003A2A26B|nr:CAP domain-containing protein [Actinomadura atramentaria]